MTLKRTILSILFIAAVGQVFAQRHYTGIEGIEASGGSSIFHGTAPYGSIGYSKYKSRVSFWKVGINYLQKKYESGNEKQNADNIYLDASYNRTVATNRTSLFLNLGLGALAGTEIYRQEKKQYDFIAGGKLEAELEFFIASRTALVGRITQLWSPLSDIRKWDTTWQVGIKYLIY